MVIAAGYSPRCRIPHGRWPRPGVSSRLFSYLKYSCQDRGRSSEHKECDDQGGQDTFRRRPASPISANVVDHCLPPGSHAVATYRAHCSLRTRSMRHRMFSCVEIARSRP